MTAGWDGVTSSSSMPVNDAVTRFLCRRRDKYRAACLRTKTSVPRKVSTLQMYFQSAGAGTETP